MCGISGILSPALAEAHRNDIVRQMMKLQQHRGPDDSGTYSDAQISLGHNRLSILDLAHGKQPIFNESKNVVVIYNGEMYNYRELRADLLQKGHVFSTNTDTEVIVHAFEEWGEAAFIRFNGMFAFALWDIAKQELYLVRDRLGIKPLYYLTDGKKVCFSSEIKAMNALPDFNLAIDPDGLARYLCFQNQFGANTLYSHVQKVEPASYHKVNRDLLCTKKQYFQLQFSMDYSKSFSDWTEEFSSVFNASVKRHMIADVRVGSYLSGGFDSSLVAWGAQKNLAPEQLFTFNGYFAEGPGYDESPLAEEVARSIGSNHHKVVITSDDFRNEIEKIVYHLDEPMMGPGSFSQYVVAREIAKEVKVVLTGHGGDEFMGGYPVYKAALLKENPFRYRKEIFNGLTVPDFIRLAYFSIFPMFRPLLRSGLHVLFTPRDITALLGDGILPNSLENNLMAEAIPFIHSDLKPFNKTLHNYIKGYLPGLFIVEDKISMAHSLESRTPFCDNEMLALSTRIPADMKLHGGQLKAISKAFAKDKLPASLYKQPKRGFPTPVHLWFQGPLKKWMEDRILQSGNSVFNAKAVKKIWSTFLSLRHDNLYTYNYGCKLFSLLCVNLLLTQSVNGKKIQVN